jgi:hypothetical protein
VNLSAALWADGRPPTVTVTSTFPDPAGDVTEQEVALEHFTPVAAFDPNWTTVPPATVENPVPVMATVVPPVAGPDPGLIAVTVGGVYANWSFPPVADVWPPTVTVTFTLPQPAGAVAEQALEVEHFTPVAAFDPNWTTVPPATVENPAPVMVTFVPPAADPAAGLIPLTVGGPAR